MKKTLKDTLAKLIKEEQDLKSALEVIQAKKEFVASELLDSVKSDSYSLEKYTIYRKPFYKIEIKNEDLVDEYMITKKVLDTKAVTKDYIKKGAVAGLEITKTTKVIVRTKTEI